MAEPIRKLVTLLITDPAAITDLLEAQWELVRARLARKRQPLGQLIEGVPNQPLPVIVEIVPAHRAADAVDRVSRLGVFRPTCLERALALQRMLHRRKLGPAVIRIGVRIRNGVFSAHAWIQLGDLVLGDDSWRAPRFQPLEDVRIVKR